MLHGVDSMCGVHQFPVPMSFFLERSIAIILMSLWYTRRRLLLALWGAATAVGKSFVSSLSRRAGEWASRYCC